MRLLPLLTCCTVLTLAGACAPALDWRETRPADGRMLALFPCKPAGQERRLALAGRTVPMVLFACAAGGQTWGLAWAELEDPGLLGQALAELQAAATANVGAATPGHAGALGVPGATPHPASRRLQLQGHHPDGRPLRMELALFVHGTRVYQASVVGSTPPADAVVTFFDALRLQP